MEDCAVITTERMRSAPNLRKPGCRQQILDARAVRSPPVCRILSEFGFGVKPHGRVRDMLQVYISLQDQPGIGDFREPVENRNRLAQVVKHSEEKHYIEVSDIPDRDVRNV